MIRRQIKGKLRVNGGGKLERSPEIIEAELAINITVATLMVAVMTSLPGSLTPDQIDVYCGGEYCSIRWSFYFLGNFSLCCSMMAFLISVCQMISWRQISVLPDQDEEADQYFVQFKEEFRAVYLLLLFSMLFGMFPMGLLYYVHYDDVSLTVMNILGAVAALFMCWWMYKEHQKVAEIVILSRATLNLSELYANQESEGNPQLVRYQEFLKSIDDSFEQYAHAFVKAGIDLRQLPLISTEDLVTYVKIPFGHALCIYEALMHSNYLGLTEREAVNDLQQYHRANKHSFRCSWRYAE